MRAQISTAYRHEAACRAARIVANHAQFKQSQHIACYFSYKDEFDTAPLIETIWQTNKCCYVPVLSKDKKSLYFVRYEYGDALHLNCYSILEPVDTSSVMPSKALDMVMTPLIAFDRQGHRVGTGGGYYDRTFDFVKDSKKPRLIGLAYASQEARLLPSDPWDVLLEGVVTECEFIQFDH